MLKSKSSSAATAVATSKAAELERPDPGGRLLLTLSRKAADFESGFAKNSDDPDRIISPCIFFQPLQILQRDADLPSVGFRTHLNPVSVKLIGADSNSKVNRSR